MAGENHLNSIATANPYVGPRSFHGDETLYGRDKEVADLLDLLVSERIVLLFSPSGAGKSSLIQAALLPALSEEDFTNLGTGRFGSVPLDLVPQSNPYCLSLILSLEQSLPEEQQLDVEALKSVELSAYLGHRLEMLDDQSSGLIVLDQFEEILTLNPTDTDHKYQFFQQLGKALADHDIWCLLSMREDFLAGLNAYREQLPTRLAITYRLNLLDRTAAMAAMRKPAASLGVDFHKDAAADLVDSLSEIGVQQADGTTSVQIGNHVEPVQLQVVCRRLWEGLAAGRTVIDREDVARVGNVDQALAAYYASCAHDVALQTGQSERSIRRWCERKLIAGNSLRGQTVHAEADEVTKSAINALVDHHLLRVERRHGTAWLELAHDRLVRPVLADNKRWWAQHLSFLQQQAPLWDQQGRNRQYLLKGKILRQAERELGDEPLTTVETAFLKSSQDLRKNVYLRVAILMTCIGLAVGVIYLYIQNHKQSIRHSSDVVELEGKLETKREMINEIETELEIKQQEAQKQNAELKEKEENLAQMQNVLERSKREIEDNNQAKQDWKKELKRLKIFEAEAQAKIAKARTEELTIKRALKEAERARAEEQQRLQALTKETEKQRRQFRALDLASRVPGLAQNEKNLAGFVALEAYAAQQGMKKGTLADVDRALRTALAALGGTTNPVIAREQEAIYSLARHPQQEVLCWGTSPGELVLRTTQKTQIRLPLTAPIRSLAWHPSGSMLAVGLRGAPIQLYHYQDKLRAVPITAPAKTTYSLIFGRDGNYMYSGHKDGSLSVWRMGEEPKRLETKGWQGDGSIWSLAISPDNRKLAIAANQLWIWTLNTKTGPRAYPEIKDCYSLAWSPTNQLAVGTRHQGISILRPSHDELPIQLHATHAIVTGLAFDKGSLVSSWSDGVLRIWDQVREDLLPREIKGHSRAIIRMVASTMPATFYTCSVDQTIRRWTVSSQSLIDPLCQRLQDAQPSAKGRQQFPDLGGYQKICPNLGVQ